MPDTPLLQDGAVAVKDGRILQTGNTGALRGEHPEHEFVDAGGGLIMPGLVNAHHHFYSALARGMITSHPKISKNLALVAFSVYFSFNHCAQPFLGCREGHLL